MPPNYLENVACQDLECCPCLLIPEHDPGCSRLVPEKQGCNPSLLAVSPVKLLRLGLVNNLAEKREET